MVRPELPEGEGRTVRINVRATPAIHDKAKAMAEAGGISVADLIERFLFHLTESNMPPPKPAKAEKVKKSPKKKSETLRGGKKPPKRSSR